MADNENGQCFIVCHKANGAVSTPNLIKFAKLEDALKNVASADSINAGEIRVVCVKNEAASPNLESKPRYHFYVDSQLSDLDGNGSERDPWSSMDKAANAVENMHSEGQIQLEADQQLVIEQRQIFTASPLERVKQRRETIAKFILMSMSIVLVLPVLSILFYLVYQAWPSLNMEFLTTNPKSMGTQGGIWAPLIGTFFLVMLSLFIAAPIGVLSGVYLNEYAGDNWFTRIINLAVVNLAGVPSIVHALFGLGAFVLAANLSESLIAASLTLSVMTLPVIITSTREALSSVPMSFREACWNMGASKWQTIRTIVLPNSISGILTGVILQVARAAGETAPIIFTGAAIFLPIADEGIGYWLPYGLGDKVMALSMHLYTLREQIPNAPLSVQYGTAVVLIGLVLCVNSVSIGLRIYLRSRKKW